MTRTTTASVEQIRETPDKYQLTVRLDTNHGTVTNFEAELTEGAARRLLIDLVHEVGVPEDEFDD